jgi:hypothetical protein
MQDLHAVALVIHNHVIMKHIENTIKREHYNIQELLVVE